MKKSCIIFVAIVLFGFAEIFLAQAEQAVEVELQFEQDPAGATEIGNSPSSDDATQADLEIIKVYGTDESGQEAGALETATEATTNAGDAIKEVQYYLWGDPAENMLILAQQEGIYNKELESLAKQQAVSDSGLQEAKAKIEKRHKLLNFIAGPDFKNLKLINKVISQNAEVITNLKEIAEKMDNIKVRKETLDQLETLKKNNQAIQNYVTEKSRQFSLFGWLVRFFN
jgi:hypothetical protein